MSDDTKRAESLGVLENNNVDNSVNPPTMVRGIMAKNTTSGWQYLSAANNYLMVSGTFTSTGLSANQQISALLLGGTAFIGDVSGLSPDAALFRVSAIGGTAGDRTLVDGTTQTISATLTPISAKPAGTVAGLVTNNFQSDASQFHASAFVDSGSISAKNQDANFMHVSGFNPDAGLFRISGILAAGVSSVGAASFGVSAAQLDAGVLHASAFVDSGSISAKNQDANFMHVSGFSPDAGLFRISSIQINALSSVGAASFGVSAAQIDAGVLHTSAFVDSGSVSAKSPDANNLHTSAYLGVDTTGTLTTFQTLSVSASQSIKGSAGVLYGYYLFNTDKNPNYVKFYNVSAAANIGTDTPLFTVCLPASAAANMEFPHGIKGFTNGINVTATSGRPLDNTALPAASSVGAVLFYN